jgi:cell division septation protein DedD
MNYDFTLDRKGVISVLGSSVLMGALLFVAGLIVGSYWTANGPTMSAAVTKKNPVDKNLIQVQEPVRPELAEFNVAATDKPVAALNSEKAGPATLTAPQVASAPPQSPADAQASTAAAAQEQGADNKAANGTTDGAEKRTTQPEDSSAANQAQAADAPNLVTVEVGTFLDANAANKLFKSLERKGYAPTFFTGRDAQAREWFSIRIGAYSDKQQAENAAANFAKQEKLKAIVRPLGSL